MAEKEIRGIKNAQFVTSVGYGAAYLELEEAQIAFVGKSNVGKSSLINALCNRNKLAKTSSSPGKTRLINYFACNRDTFYLVDLPGYGYAKAPKTEQQKWGELIEGYLRSGMVTHLFLLLDSRHAPGEGDRMMFHWIQYYNLPYTLIATKLDKLPKSRRAAALKALQKELGAIGQPLGVSAAEKSGLEAIWQQIDNIVDDFDQRKHPERFEKTSEELVIE